MKKLIDNDVLSTKSSNDWEHDEDNDITFPRDAGGHIELTAADSIIGNSIWDYGIKGPTFDIKIPNGSFSVNETGQYQEIGMCFNIDKDEFEKYGVDTDCISFWIGDKGKKTGRLISIGSEISITKFNDGKEDDYIAWHQNNPRYLDTVAISNNQCTISYDTDDLGSIVSLEFAFHSSIQEGNIHGCYSIPGYFFGNGESMTMPIILPSGNETTVTVTRASGGVQLNFGKTDSNYQFVGARLVF